MSCMENPLISIIVCTYNRVSMLQQAISSIFAQKYDPIEIVIIDDGSTDNTEKLIFTYEKKVRYFKKKREGIAKARNFGAKVAKGEFISFLDDDDLMPENKNVILHNSLLKYPNAIFVVGDWLEINQSGDFTGKRSKGQLKIKNKNPILIDNAYEAVIWPKIPAAPHTTLFRKIHGEQINWFDEQYRYASEDKDFFSRLGKLGPVVYVPEVVSYYRRGHISLTSNYLRARYNKIKFLENHLLKLDSNENVLKNRLKFRIYLELIRLAYYSSDKETLQNEIPHNFIKIKLSLLDPILRYKYLWISKIYFPVKRFFKKILFN